jgi:phage gpG-like protein
MKARATIVGLGDLLRKLKELPEKADLAIKKGVDRTALAIESSAKRKITSDGHIITGRLRASIHAELTEGKSFTYSDNKGNSFEGALEEAFGKLEAVVGTNVFYAPFIEFGTKNFSGDSFLNWAAVKEGALLKDRIEQELMKLLK